ncbi:MAG: GDSL-type esterase/lipase family protein [Hominenteromicrobium sp.]
MADRNRRRARPAPQPQRPARRPKKRKKINWFRVTVITAGLAVVALAALGILQAAESAAVAESSPGEPQTQTDPEFFSTIKPAAEDAVQVDSGSAEPEPTSAFDGALFVGDSLTAQLEDYVEQGAGSSTVLHDAVFVTSDSYSWADAANEISGGTGGLPLDEQTVTLSTAILKTGARKLYIQLGKEDLIYNDVTTVTDNAKRVLSALKQSYPSLEITVQSVTPMLQWIDYMGLSSRTIAAYNEEMKAYCAAEGFGFADVAAFFADGYLPAEYCADPGQLCIHLNDAGCALWTSYLLGEIQPEPTPTPEPENDALTDTGDGDGADYGGT